MKEILLDRQVVIVTGASAGIGEATVRMLAREGATVVLAARRKARLDQLRKEIEASGGSALAIEADITSEEDRQRIVLEVKRTLEAFSLGSEAIDTLYAYAMLRVSMLCCCEEVLCRWLNSKPMARLRCPSSFASAPG